MPHPATIRTQAWACERNFAFVTHRTGKGFWIFLPGRAVQLPEQHEGETKIYRAGDIELRVRGDRARLRFEAGDYHHCRNDPARAFREQARLEGYDFLARGGAPRWRLLLGEAIRLEILEGEATGIYHFTTPEAEIQPAARHTRYNTQNRHHQLRLTLSGKTCFDRVTGRLFDVTVLVELDDRVLHGCGEALL
ncbi:MAG TPA: hypothetical protein ENK40_03965 [Gammaproteobacteria bacterium]|nr:hypothetical protein [Gammaproteobacteria bacterium]